MSTLNLFKRFISIFLVFSVALSLPASQAVRVDIDIANGADGIFTESEEHEKSLRSLMTQLGTSGIKAWGVTGGEVLASPSGIDHRARVSCVTPKINATYDAPQTATVIFKLNTPNERDVSFTYTIYSGSASYNEHFTGTSSGTVIFEAGVVEKELVIEIPKLINNPSEYELPSKPGEFWTKDRVFYINCNNLSNALFDNEKQSMTVPIYIENLFDFIQAYNNAKNTYLADMSELTDAIGVPETPGKFQNTADELKIADAAAISNDCRIMIDTGVFSHINLPIGYFSNNADATGDVRLKIGINQKWESVPTYENFLSVDGMSKIDFSPEDLGLFEIRLGGYFEQNGMVRSLDIAFDYTGLSQDIYTCFIDQSENYLQQQINFTDKINPSVKDVIVPSGTFCFGEFVPITVVYSEPVLADAVSIKANGAVLYPVERSGTVTESVSFSYEVTEKYADLIEVTDILGAVDLSGKEQDTASEYALTNAVLCPFDAKKTFTYCADTTVNIEQDASGSSTGEIILSVKENIELNFWFAGKLQPDGLLPVVKARVIGKDGAVLDVPLYANSGPTITELTGEFNAPANLSAENEYYAAEIYFSENGTDYELLYALSKEYVIAPIIYIDDEADLEIVYTDWPSLNKIPSDSITQISLGYNIKNNATWQSADDFLWASNNESVATITADGDIVLTGKVGTVAFNLTALNGGLAGKEFTIYSKELEVIAGDTTFLRIPDGLKSIELTKGNNARVYYSANITESNDLYAGSGTVTTFTFDLYEAEYIGGELTKGELVHRQTLDTTVQNNNSSYVVDEQYLVNTSEWGKYSYIFEIYARDLLADRVLTATANIRVKELPATAILNKPQEYYTTDESGEIKVKFDVENKNANTRVRLSVKKNEEETPVFTANSIADADKEHELAISAVAGNRLLDVYTVSLIAKNEFDEAFSYDSYLLYVYNSNALKIMVNGFAVDSLTMRPDANLPEMTSREILDLNRKISVTDEISINNKQYRFSSFADKIVWQVGDDSKISLKYNDGGVYRDIQDYPINAFLPGSSFLLQGKTDGNSFLTATHDLTGMESQLDVTVDDISDELYIFRVYPTQQSRVSYTNGENRHKTAETDDRGRLAVYEESGIISDVYFEPKYSGIYLPGIIKNSDLLANQKSSNDFGLYPQNNITLPLARYRLGLDLFDEEANEYYVEDIIIRGGVYRNGHYCPDAKINGISGAVDQEITGGRGAYDLNFNPLEFTTQYDTTPLTDNDRIEYVIEVRFPDNSYNTKIIKVDSQTIKQNKYLVYGSYLKEKIQRQDSERVRDSVNIISQALAIDGVKQPLPEQIILERNPESAVINIEMMLPGDYNNDYEIEISDEHGEWSLFSETVKEVYEFSSTVTLRNSFNLHKRLFYIRPGQKSNLYITIRVTGGGKLTEIKLPKFITVQSLVDIPNMVALTDQLDDISTELVGTAGGPYYFDFDGDDDNVKKTLDFLSRYSVGTDSIRLEITPTDDPLVYKGVIKFAAGDLTRENPSGVFSANDNSSASYKFMPGRSDLKAIKKGDYISKSKAKMEEYKAGLAKNSYKTYGGGAYMECEIFYDVDAKEWEMLVLKSDVYLGAGGGYFRNYNTWVGPIPVTAEFRTGMSAQAGLKTVAEKIYNEDNTDYEIKRDYISELRPYFYIYGFGGFGFDYVVASFKVGVYGKISLDQHYLWHNKNEANGQKIEIAGTTGVKFQTNVLFIYYSKSFELGGASKTWKYNDYDKINGIFDSNQFFSSDGYAVLEPVGETSSFEDRSYLESYNREWHAPKSRLFSDDAVTVIQTNAYPHTNPVITDDGGIMAYISDMDSTNINDTAICFTKRNPAGSYPPGIEIDSSDYADTDAVIDGTGDKVAVAWTRVMSEIKENAGSDATLEDLRAMMSGTEIMAGIYNGTDFIATRLTDNTTADMAPVVATNGSKTIVAWRSLYASDVDNPLDFDGRDNIMYSIFDGTNWSDAKCLYDGSVNKVSALNAEMLSDGTSAIVYQVNKDGGENAEVFCAVLDENGNIVDSPKLTKNEIRDENPQITALIFPDGVERFVIGRNSVKNVDGEDENIISLSAVNGGGILYPQFEKEIENTAEPSNYKRFRFSKGADNPEDLSIVWVERETESDDIHRDNIWGRKFITSDDGDITLSPKIKLLKLDDNNAVDFYDCYVNSGTKEINFALLTTEESYAEVQSELSVARVSYKNNLVVKKADFSREDLLPGTDMPVMFRLYNDGVERIEGVTINIAGVPHAFDGEDFVIQPGEYKDFTVLYPVPESVCNPDYSITAQFTTVSDVKSGTLIMDIPDTGIYNIELTKQAGRERGFSVWLCNNSVSKLTEGRHAVTLEVYNTPSFNNAPVMTRTFSDAENLNKINDGMLIQEILLSEVEIKSILDDNGEIPEDGARIYFNTVLSENGAVIDDADISNNSDYVRLNSLLKERKPVSVTTLMHAEPDRTVVKVEAFNNSMNEITNGNIVVNLRDENGDIIETRQTFASEGADTGVITLAGEEAFEATFEFSETGAYNDAVFTTVADGGALLSELKLSGVPVDFDKNIYDYSAQVTGLHETLLTVVPENPDSVITITNNGNHVSNGRCPLVYGENNIEISVRKDINDVKYTVSIQNIRDGDDTCTISAIKGIDKPVAGKIPVSTITETEQYTGSVTWSGSPETFGYDTVYTATITLTPKDGYTVTGIGGNFFTVEHASSVTNPSDSGVITAVFPKTASRPSPTPTTSSNTSKRSAQNYNTIYQNPFEDVSETDWFYQAVQFAYENNLMKGTGANTFNPNLHTTRGMLVTILYRMEGEPSIEPSGFSDVAEDEYYANAIAWARKNGIVKGVSETRFEPDIGITREQAAVILHRYAGFKGVDTSKRVELSGYSDSGTISDYALPAMEWAVGTGLINGRSATITAPRENITRAEVCAVLQRFLNAL